MMKLFTLLLLFISTLAYSQVQVKGYYRKDGTYVRPHVRTAPNSTVTDNYSYHGNYNPNLEYNKPLPTSSPSSNYNSSNSTAEKEWVNGYYRNDGTYVNGYYRNKRSTNSSTSDNSNTNYLRQTNTHQGSNLSTKKYVNTTKVNFRTSPELSDNIIGELSYLDKVTYVSSVGNWDKVEVQRYNPETYKYVTFQGYINNTYLSGSTSAQSTQYKNETPNYQIYNESKYYKVISNKAYFYSTPNIKNKKKHI